MDDQYYYLLDGKEQGPFSRAAIESLAANGALASALLRTASDPTWRTAKEIGLSSAKASEPPKPNPAVDKYGFPIKEGSDVPPLRVATRSSAKSRSSNPSSKSAAPTIAMGLVVVALAAVGVWFALEKPNIGFEAPETKGKSLSDLAVGDWSIQTGTLSKEPEKARLFRIRNGGLLLDPDRTSQQGVHSYLVDSMGLELRHRTGFRLYENTIDGDDCLLATFKYATRSPYGTIESIQKQGPCIALKDREFSNFDYPPVVILQGEMYWTAMAEAIKPIRFKVLTITEHPTPASVRSSNKTNDQKTISETYGSPCGGEALPCQTAAPALQSSVSTENFPVLSGTYTCEVHASPVPISCSFIPSKAAVISLVGGQAAEEVQSLSFTNPNDLVHRLAVDEMSASSGCLIGGQASVQVSSHKLLDGEGGYHIEAKLESVTTREYPKILVGDDQLESCQSI